MKIKPIFSLTKKYFPLINFISSKQKKSDFFKIIFPNKKDRNLTISIQYPYQSVFKKTYSSKSIQFNIYKFIKGLFGVVV